MKKKQILLALVLMAGLFICSTNNVKAGGVIIWGTAERVREIAELPDSGYYMTDDNQYFDMGVRYNTIHIFWIPLWVSSSPIVCGYVNSDTYVELSQADIDEITAAEEIDLKGKVKATFWDSIGGKIVILLIVGGVLAFYFRDKITGNKESAEE